MLPYGNGVTMTRVTLSNDARSTYTKDFPETRSGLAAGLHPTASVIAWSDGTTVWAFDLRDPTTNVRYPGIPDAQRVPSFLGLGLGRAVDLAKASRLRLELSGSGVVVAQEPPAGSVCRGPLCQLRLAPPH